MNVCKKEVHCVMFYDMMRLIWWFEIKSYERGIH